MLRIIIILIVIGVIPLVTTLWLWTTIARHRRGIATFWIALGVLGCNAVLAGAMLFLGLLATRVLVNGHYEYNTEFACRVFGIPTLIGLTIGNVLGLLLFLRQRVYRM
jgi:hypothetical protein